MGRINLGAKLAARNISRLSRIMLLVVGCVLAEKILGHDSSRQTSRTDKKALGMMNKKSKHCMNKLVRIQFRGSYTVKHNDGDCVGASTNVVVRYGISHPFKALMQEGHIVKVVAGGNIYKITAIRCATEHCVDACP